MTKLALDPLTPLFGAEVRDIALRPDLDADTIRAIRDALVEHKVVFFRAQSFDARTLTEFARRFGEPPPAHPVEPSVEGHPEVLSLDSDEGARADVWHSA